MSEDNEEPPTPASTDPRLEPPFPFEFLRFDPDAAGVDTIDQEQK